jgi:hypothetical protein
VPESVLKAYGLQRLSFGRDYLIPKPFDPRVLMWVAPAVAKAAMDSGVARRPLADLPRTASRSSASWALAPGDAPGRAQGAAQGHAAPRVSRGRAPDGRARRADDCRRPHRAARAPRPSEVDRGVADEFGFALHDYDVIDIERSPQLARYADELYSCARARG